MDYEHLKHLAAEGATNTEIFAALELSPAEVKRQVKANHLFVFAVIEGRKKFTEDILGAVHALALGRSTHNEYRPSLAASIHLLERCSSENRALSIGYELALLEGAPSGTPDLNVSASELTSLLRAAK